MTRFHGSNRMVASSLLLLLTACGRMSAPAPSASVDDPSATATIGSGSGSGNDPFRFHWTTESTQEVVATPRSGRWNPSGQPFQDLRLFLENGDLRLVDPTVGIARFDVSRLVPTFRYASRSQPTFNPQGLPWSATSDASVGIVDVGVALAMVGTDRVRAGDETNASLRLTAIQPEINGVRFAAMVRGPFYNDVTIFQRTGEAMIHSFSPGRSGNYGRAYLNTEVRCAVRVGDSIYVATASGLYRLSFGAGRTLNAPEKLSDLDVAWLSESNGEIFASVTNRPGRIYRFFSSGAPNGVIVAPGISKYFQVQSEWRRVWYPYGGMLVEAAWE